MKIILLILTHIICLFIGRYTSGKKLPKKYKNIDIIAIDILEHKDIIEAEFQEAIDRSRQKAWKNIHEKLRDGIRNGQDKVKLWDSDYKSIPYNALKDTLKMNGYKLEFNSKTWYREGYGIDVYLNKNK